MPPTPYGEKTQAMGARRQSAAQRLSRALIRTRTDPPEGRNLIVNGMAMVSPPHASAKPGALFLRLVSIETDPPLCGPGSNLSRKIPAPFQDFDQAPTSSAARPNTPSNISSVNRPVNVFCCDGW